MPQLKVLLRLVGKFAAAFLPQVGRDRSPAFAALPECLFCYPSVPVVFAFVSVLLSFRRLTIIKVLAALFLDVPVRQEICIYDFY